MVDMHERFTLGKMQNPVRGFLHGSAAVAAVVGTIVLIVKAQTWGGRIALGVFGVGLVSLYTTSSLYHSVPWRETWKGRMQRLDHSMIFVLIAASFAVPMFLTVDFTTTAGESSANPSPVTYVLGFFMYLALAYIAIFFKTAMLCGADQHIRGETPSIGSAVSPILGGAHCSPVA